MAVVDEGGGRVGICGEFIGGREVTEDEPIGGKSGGQDKDKSQGNEFGFEGGKLEQR